MLVRRSAWVGIWATMPLATGLVVAQSACTGKTGFQLRGTTLTMTPVATVVAGARCVAVDIVFEPRDASESLHLSADAPGAFYADEACATPIATIAYPVGAASLRVYFAAQLVSALARSIQIAVWGETSGLVATATLQIRSTATLAAVGEQHSCFVAEGRHLQCAGFFEGGAHDDEPEVFADNLAFFRPVPRPDPWAEISALSAGTEFSCLATNGAAYCWGVNFCGSDACGTLGIGAFVANPNREEPVEPVRFLDAGVSDVSAGYEHACAIKQGQALCWGGNADGKLGDGTTLDTNEPVPVQGLDSEVLSIRCARDASCALLQGGEVWCWGGNDTGELGYDPDPGSPTPVHVTALPVPVEALDAAEHARFFCALAGGGVYCWGGNYEYQLGRGTRSGSETPDVVPGLDSGVTLMAAGPEFACALREGALWCWGTGTWTDVGGALVINPQSPTQIQTPAGTITALVAGGSGAQPILCAIVDGLPYCWGGRNGFADGVRKEAALPRPAPQIPQSAALLDLSTFYRTFGCSLTQAGGVKCWGRGSNGQLGNGAGDSSHVSVWVHGLGDGSGVSAISVGWECACALVDGGLWCWGVGTCTGDGSETHREIPVQIVPLSTGVSQVSMGTSACAIQNGALWCWGSDDGGELGNGPPTGDDALAPVAVVGLDSGVTRVGVGHRFACAVHHGAAKCWGNNPDGQLGNGEANVGINSNTPVNVVGLEQGVQDIVCGAGSCCALTESNAVKCWGLLGDDLGVEGLPMDVPGLDSGVTRLRVGGRTACALQAGILKCWGRNYKGQCGVGHLNPVDEPTPVQGLPAPVRTFDVGGIEYRGFVCALTDDGPYCWGDNVDRQLADGLPYLTPDAWLLEPWYSEWP